MRLQSTYPNVRTLRQVLDEGWLDEAELAVPALRPAELADVLLQLDPIVALRYE